MMSGEIRNGAVVLQLLHPFVFRKISLRQRCLAATYILFLYSELTHSQPSMYVYGRIRRESYRPNDSELKHMANFSLEMYAFKKKTNNSKILYKSVYYKTSMTGYQ